MDSKENKGRVYHQETKYHRGTLRGGALKLPQPSPFKEYPQALSFLPLPDPKLLEGKPLWECLSFRRSLRSFSDEALALEELSQLLWATQGLTSTLGHHQLRTAPSAGALYPIETHLVINRVEEIPAGLYHYNVLRHGLELLRSGEWGPQVARAALGQTIIAHAGVTFLWTAIMGRSEWKYKDRAYRYIAMDAGHIAQNLYLAATALNLAVCTIGAFFDDEINEILQVDGEEESVLYLGVVGKKKKW